MPVCVCPWWMDVRESIDRWYTVQPRGCEFECESTSPHRPHRQGLLAIAPPCTSNRARHDRTMPPKPHSFNEIQTQSKQTGPATAGGGVASLGPEAERDGPAASNSIPSPIAPTKQGCSCRAHFISPSWLLHLPPTRRRHQPAPCGRGSSTGGGGSSWHRPAGAAKGPTPPCAGP